MADNEELLRKIDALQERLSLMEDRDAIQRLHYWHGIEGLRIADTSVMPRIVGGNTAAPAVMIGEKLSDMMKPHSPETV